MEKTIGPIFEHACHEGNYGLSNILAGARLEDKKSGGSGRREIVAVEELAAGGL